MQIGGKEQKDESKCIRFSELLVLVRCLRKGGNCLRSHLSKIDSTLLQWNIVLPLVGWCEQEDEVERKLELGEMQLARD